jgi:hypothetical protein
MAITSSYLVAVTRLGEMLDAVQNAQAPDRFTTKFLTDLGFKSTNDRLFISVLKGLKFLDQSGTPQQRYFDYLDKNESKRILADGIREAYEDLFRVKKDANTLKRDQVKNKLKSLTQGQYSTSVLHNMASTFVELVKFADFEASAASSTDNEPDSSKNDDEVESQSGDESPQTGNASHRDKPVPSQPQSRRHFVDALSYRIEVVLPTTRDRAVYDAIFRSLKDHLL